jgi:hypothetical protein
MAPAPCGGCHGVTSAEDGNGDNDQVVATVVATVCKNADIASSWKIGRTVLQKSH